MAFPDVAQLRRQFQKSASALWGDLSNLAAEWIKPILARLDSPDSVPRYPKTINDPVWGSINVLPHELLFLDSPMMQRLRGVRQLGMAHLVYPSALHDRFEHSLGVLEASERIMRALVRNAEVRKRYGEIIDREIPTPSDEDRTAIRLAGLLHDTGHGPYSHATERLILNAYLPELAGVQQILRDTFKGATDIPKSETITTMIVLSEPIERVFTHRSFAAGVTAADLPVRIAARVLGSRTCLDAQYLSGVVSGPIDADKLDYMARDSLHAGLPMAIDISRLIDKLEVVTVTPENASNAVLRRRAEEAQHRRFHELGISESGLAAFEQMVISRVMLYDRLYFHHKVRGAEAMVRQVVRLVEQEDGKAIRLPSWLERQSDDTWLSLVSRTPSGNGGDEKRSVSVATAIVNRDLWYRAYAFASRFVSGLEDLKDAHETRTVLWMRILAATQNEEGQVALAKEIVNKARQVGKAIPALAQSAEELLDEHVLIDVSRSDVVARSTELLVRTQSGRVVPPTMFFNPEAWSEAYMKQKQLGLIFSPRRFVPLVSLASRIVFFEKFATSMTEAADDLVKLGNRLDKEWLREACAAGACSEKCVSVLLDRQPELLHLDPEDLKLPDRWGEQRPGTAKRLAQDFNSALPTGVSAQTQGSVIDAIEHLCEFLVWVDKQGIFVGHDELSERLLQSEVCKFLRARKIDVREGEVIAGGEADLILPNDLVLENKVRPEKTANPHEVGKKYDFQDRRYSLAFGKSVGLVLLAYRPTSESAILPAPDRVKISRLAVPEERAQIRFVLPWGQPTPHDARA